MDNVMERIRNVVESYVRSMSDQGWRKSMPAEWQLAEDEADARAVLEEIKETGLYDDPQIAEMVKAGLYELDEGYGELMQKMIGLDDPEFGELEKSIIVNALDYKFEDSFKAVIGILINIYEKGTGCSYADSPQVMKFTREPEELAV